ncbi:MAG: type II secretion system F family protein [Anaerolineaceae bacterium]|nr:type II secretion system F family protein [Anaerolineaceae bacterium]
MSLLRRIPNKDPKGKNSASDYDEDIFSDSDFDLEDLPTVDELTETDSLTDSTAAKQTESSGFRIAEILKGTLRLIGTLTKNTLEFLSARGRLLLMMGVYAGLVLLLGWFLYSVRDIVGLPGIVAILVVIGVIVYSIISVRRGRDLIEERLGRYESDYDSFSYIWEEESDTGQVQQKNLSLLIDEALRDAEWPWWYPGKRAKQRLNQAGLNVTLGEYFAIHVIFVWIGVLISISILPRTIMAVPIFGAFAYIIPDIVVARIARNRLRLFDTQFPYALALWSGGLKSGFSVIQSIEALAKSTLNPVAPEFQRVIIDLRLGNTLEEALDNLQKRIPSHYLNLAIDAVQVHLQDGSPLDETLSSVNNHVQRLQQIRSRNGNLVYLHDLLFPLVVAIVFVQSYLLEKYFAALWGNATSTAVFIAAFALITVTMLVGGETGKKLRRLEKQYDLVRYRDPATNAVVQVVRIISFLLFGYYHLMNPSLINVLWAWFMFLSLETAYVSLSILALLVGMGTQIQWQFQLDHIMQSIQRGISPSIDEIVIGGIVVVVVGIVVATLQYYRDYLGRDPIQERMALFGEIDETVSLREIELSLSFFDRSLIPLLAPIGRFVSRFTPVAQVEFLQAKIRQASLNTSPETIILERIFLTGVFSFSVFYALSTVAHLDAPWVVLCMLIAAVGGNMIPLLYLNQRIQKRRSLVEQEIPDLILLLDIRMKGRMTTLGVFEAVFERWDMILGTALGKVVGMVQLGMPLEQALNQVAADFNNPELSYLGAGILKFQKNNDGLLTFISGLREQVYQKRETEIQERTRRYRLWHNFACRYLLWVGLSLWFLSPLISG